MKDLSRKVSLHCPVCGNTMFANVDDNIENMNLSDAADSALFKCSDCGNIISKGDLIKLNEAVIVKIVVTKSILKLIVPSEPLTAISTML